MSGRERFFPRHSLFSTHVSCAIFFRLICICFSLLIEIICERSGMTHPAFAAFVKRTRSRRGRPRSGPALVQARGPASHLHPSGACRRAEAGNFASIALVQRQLRAIEGEAGHAS